MPFSDPKPVDHQLTLISRGLAAIFFATGLTHVLRLKSQVTFFERLDLPVGAITVVGLCEWIFAIMLLVPRTRPWGAIGLCGLMFGAALAHIMTGSLLSMLFVHATLIYAAIWVFVKSRPLWLRVTP